MKTCADCVFFDGTYHECRKNPPVYKADEMTPQRVFPDVDPDNDWCGELVLPKKNRYIPIPEEIIECDEDGRCWMCSKEGCPQRTEAVWNKIKED